MRRNDTYSKVLTAIQEGAKNTNQIHELTGINRATIKNALSSLRSLKLIDENNNLTSPITINPHTVLGIPLTKEQEKLACQIINRIKELNNLSRTVIQKILVKVIKTHNLEIPHGYYLYGDCSALIYYDDLLPKYGSTKEFDRTIKETIAEYGKFSNTDELLEYLYREENQPIYLSRLTINRLLKQPFTKTNIEIILTELKNILFENNNKLLDAFDTCFIRLSKLPIEKIESLRMTIIAAFNNVWEIIAAENFSENNNINQFKELRISALKESANNYLMELKDYWPNINTNNEQIKLALDRLNDPADPKILKKQNEELDKIKREQGIEEYFKELRRRFGFK